ncbi:sulfotransferase [Roseobacter sinensis]|uniref:Sulfotransferase n=1 Tax=Roseobacter sinensis TaxID=2931391 RepID=A0ABT3BJV2_9RHOB|nr:sulfotransferase [Roseobacter sp. WL0113]MCV3273858.1 sulfotransferase [Roseobacter sp. WL0113]
MDSPPTRQGVAPAVHDRLREAKTAVHYRGIIARRLVRDFRQSSALVADNQVDLSQLQTWCSFLSTPRSGHSLIGALIDAHPDAVIGSEYGIVDHLIWGFSRARVAALLVADSKRIPHNFSRRFGTARKGGYTYDVAGQWQGRLRHLKVLGDKDGSADTMRFGRRPHLAPRIEQTMQAPVRFVHVYRNPFDVVSTIVRRSQRHVDGAVSIARAVAMLEERTRIHLEMIGTHGAERVFSLAHEDHIAAPQRELGALVRWLGLDADPAYLDACAALCFAAPRKTRAELGWDAEEIARVRRLIEATPFLQRYAGDEV